MKNAHLAIKLSQAVATGIGLIALAACLVGCGKQEFVPTPTSAAAPAGGSFTIPAKVDFVLIQDNTGSTFEIEDALEQDLQSFTSQLDQQGWDYHLGTFPLTSNFTINQVIASKYDGNWAQYGLWTPPYPGAQQDAPGTVGAAFFSGPSPAPAYNGFFSPEPSNADDWGFYYMVNNIQQGIPFGANLIRDDALLAIVVISNGEDSSHVNYCNRGDVINVPCEQVNAPLCTSLSQTAAGPGAAQPANCGSQALSLSSAIASIEALKPNPQMVQLYAAVGDGSTNCLGGASFSGDRYTSAALATGGQSYDICQSPLTSVFSSLTTQLQAVRLNMRTHYLFVASAPNVSTITVTVTSDSGTFNIPQGSTNGWTYAGYLTNVDAIDYPVPMNASTGYAIELNGTAELTGDETAVVNFQAAGLQPSS